jgi:D-cysteine desulfhydrase
LDRPQTALEDLISFARSAVKRRCEMKGLKGLVVIPPGASSASGTLGYVAAGMEIAAQARTGVCPDPERVYVALGTGGTAAGLALGLAIEGLDTEVVAVRVASRATGNFAFLNLLAYKSMKILQKAGIEMEMPKLNIKVDSRFIGPGYAVATKESLDSMECAKTAGLSLETTYTGKAMAALLADRRAHSRPGPLMFVNTFCPIDGLAGAPDRFKEKNP